jgi:hypothetical protein
MRLFVLSLILPSLLVAADPLTGNWVADPARAADRPVGLRSAALLLEVEGVRLTLAESGTRPDGASYSLKITADCDGKVNGVMGNPDIDAVQCWRNDSRSLMFKLLREATVREWRTAEVAKNGQTLRMTSTVEDEKGKEAKSVAMFVRK